RIDSGRRARRRPEPSPTRRPPVLVRKARPRLERELRTRRRDAERVLRRNVTVAERQFKSVERDADRRRNVVTEQDALGVAPPRADRKSTRLNSSHVTSSYAVFCVT